MRSRPVNIIRHDSNIICIEHVNAVTKCVDAITNDIGVTLQ